MPCRYQSRREAAVKNTVATALAGLVLGLVAVPLFTTSFPLALVVFAALVGLTASRQDSRALGGGFLVAFGLWWAFYVRQAVDRCDALNRQPNGGCAIYGTAEQLVLAGSVVLVGALLVAVALRGERPTA